MLIGYVIQTCCHSSCGISFAVPKQWDDEKRKDYTNFYCPNGHGQSYKKGGSAEDNLRRENERLVQNTAYLEDKIREKDQKIKREKKNAMAYKGHATRIKNRVAAGVCPCCNRTFANLASHMKTKHKDYKEQEIVA